MTPISPLQRGITSVILKARTSGKRWEKVGQSYPLKSHYDPHTFVHNMGDLWWILILSLWTGQVIQYFIHPFLREPLMVIHLACTYDHLSMGGSLCNKKGVIYVGGNYGEENEFMNAGF